MARGHRNEFKFTKVRNRDAACTFCGRANAAEEEWTSVSNWISTMLRVADCGRDVDDDEAYRTAVRRAGCQEVSYVICKVCAKGRPKAKLRAAIVKRELQGTRD